MQQISFFSNIFALTTSAYQQEHHAEIKIGWPLLKDTKLRIILYQKTQYDCATDSRVSPNILFKFTRVLPIDIYKCQLWKWIEHPIQTHFNGFNNTYYCNDILFTPVFILSKCWKFLLMLDVLNLAIINLLPHNLDLELNIKMRLAAVCIKTLK